MNGRFNMQRLPKNPVMQALSLLFFGVVLIGAVLMGAIVLAFVIGFAAVFAVVFWIRMWWITRKMRRRARSGSGSSRERSSGTDYIEVEYTVRDENDDGGRRRR